MTKLELSSSIGEPQTAAGEDDSHDAAMTHAQANTPPNAVASAGKQANRDGIEPEDILEALDDADERGTLAIEYIHEAHDAMSKLASSARADKQADRDDIEPQDILEVLNAARDHLTGALGHIDDAHDAMSTLASRSPGASVD
jgi:hypothetical protein